MNRFERESSRVKPLVCFALNLGVATIGLASHSSVQARIVTVGPVGMQGCEFTQIDDAITRGGTEIRVASGNYSGFNTRSLNLVIKGGYRNCEDAASGDRDFDTARPIIGGPFPMSVTSASTVPKRVTLERLDFTIPVTIDDRSELGVQLQVVLQSSRIRDVVNDSGLKVLGQGADVILRDTSIVNNRTELTHVNFVMGGGVHCREGRILIEGRSRIASNRALLGGGLYLEGCDLDLQAGDWNASPEYGVVDNEAHRGGGIFATSSGDEALSIGMHGGVTNPASISANRTVRFLNQNIAIARAPTSGAAMFVNGRFSAHAVNLRVDNNTDADDADGAIIDALSQVGQSSIVIGVDESCGRSLGCNSISGNAVSGSEQAAVMNLRQRGFASRLQARLLRTTWRENAFQDALVKASVIEAGDGSEFAGELLFEGLAFTGNAGFAVPGRLPVIFSLAGDARVAFTTVADNSVSALVRPLVAELNFDVFSSVIAPSTSLLAVDGSSGLLPNIETDCLAERVGSDTRVDGSFLESAPPFVEGSYELRAGSRLRDYCDDVNYAPIGLDLRGHRRGVDDASIPDNFGPYDLGAIESRASNVLGADRAVFSENPPTPFSGEPLEFVFDVANFGPEAGMTRFQIRDLSVGVSFLEECSWGCEGAQSASCPSPNWAPLQPWDAMLESGAESRLVLRCEIPSGEMPPEFGRTAILEAEVSSFGVSPSDPNVANNIARASVGLAAEDRLFEDGFE